MTPNLNKVARYQVETIKIHLSQNKTIQSISFPQDNNAVDIEAHAWNALFLSQMRATKHVFATPHRKCSTNK